MIFDYLKEHDSWMIDSHLSYKEIEAANPDSLIPAARRVFQPMERNGTALFLSPVLYPFPQSDMSIIDMLSSPVLTATLCGNPTCRTTDGLRQCSGCKIRLYCVRRSPNHIVRIWRKPPPERRVPQGRLAGAPTMVQGGIPGVH